MVRTLGLLFIVLLLAGVCHIAYETVKSYSDEAKLNRIEHNLGL